MACCIIAAYLLAQLFATVRRWALFWGLVRPRAGEHQATLIGWLRGRNPTPAARRGDW